jgi:Helicase associated domain
MDPERRKNIEALRGWSWSVHLDRWEEGFTHLKQLSELEGHCRVPTGYKTGDEYALGRWVSRQRENKDTLDLDRRQRLEALPGWVWKVEK